MKYDRENGCNPNECYWPNCKCKFPPTLTEEDDSFKYLQDQAKFLNDLGFKNPQFIIPGQGSFKIPATISAIVAKIPIDDEPIEPDLTPI